MTRRLPTLPRNTDYTLRRVRAGETLRAGTGGSRTQIEYLGDHWAVEIDTGVMGLLCARGLVADLLMGSSQIVRVPIPEPGIDKGAPGAPVVDGEDLSGSLIPMRGLTPHYVLRKGWFVTIDAAAGARAYLVTGEVIAGADSKAVVPVWPMLHVPVADGDRVELLNPWIEGAIDDDGEHSVGLMAAGEPGSFVVEELS